MSEALFSATDGFKVIEGLRRGAKNSLLMLNMEDFFQVWSLSGNETRDIILIKISTVPEIAHIPFTFRSISEKDKYLQFLPPNYHLADLCKLTEWEFSGTHKDCKYIYLFLKLTELQFGGPQICPIAIRLITLKLKRNLSYSGYTNNTLMLGNWGDVCLVSGSVVTRGVWPLGGAAVGVPASGVPLPQLQLGVRQAAAGAQPINTGQTQTTQRQGNALHGYRKYLKTFTPEIMDRLQFHIVSKPHHPVLLNIGGRSP